MAAYSDEDFIELAKAIRRYAEDDMDQWAAFRIPTKHGDAFVSIRWNLPPGDSLDAYPLFDTDV